MMHAADKMDICVDSDNINIRELHELFRGSAISAGKGENCFLGSQVELTEQKVLVASH